MNDPLDLIGCIWKIPLVLGVFFVVEYYLIVTCGGGIPFILAEIAFSLLYVHHIRETHKDELDEVG